MVAASETTIMYRMMMTSAIGSLVLIVFMLMLTRPVNTFASRNTASWFRLIAEYSTPGLE